MKLQDCREAEIDYSSRAGDRTRQLGFAGIAIVWIFKNDAGGQPAVPVGLVWATVLICIGLSVDLLHYVFGATYWGWFLKKKEAELAINARQPDEHFDEEREFTNRTWFDGVVNYMFYGKIAFIAAAYVLLFRYLAVCRLFR